jgi:hypothetical protein
MEPIGDRDGAGNKVRGGDFGGDLWLEHTTTRLNMLLLFFGLDFGACGAVRKSLGISAILRHGHRVGA